MFCFKNSFGKCLGKRNQKRKEKNSGEKPNRNQPNRAPSPLSSAGRGPVPHPGPVSPAQRRADLPSPFSLCPTAGPQPSINDMWGLRDQRLLLPQLATEPDSSPGRFNPENSGFPCPFRQTRPYKTSPPKPQLPFASKPRKRALVSFIRDAVDLAEPSVFFRRKPSVSPSRGPSQGSR